MKSVHQLFSLLKVRVGLSVFLLLALIAGGSITLSAQSKKAGKKISKKTLVKKSAKNKSKRKSLAKFQKPQTEDEFEGDPEKRREWFMMQRTFPFDDYPEDARRQAWMKRPFDADFTDSDNVPQWKSIGPAPTTSYFPDNWSLTSGRINAVVVSPANPQIVLVGAATGGVWRSTDGGATFAPTSDTQVDLAVGSIAFAPSNPSIVYAGMGDKASGYLGTGVLKSTDAGQTWTRVSSNLPAPGRISKIEVDPTNPNRVYVAQFNNRSGNTTFASGFWYSVDGGVNWTRRLAGLTRDLVIHPTQPNTLYLALTRVDEGPSSAGGVFKSTDGGQTWTRIYTSITNPSNMKIAVTPASPQSIYVLDGSTSPQGNVGQVAVSNDGGATWTAKPATIDLGQFSYNCYLYVHPTSPNTIYIGTRDLWRSTDGGLTYTNITKNFTLTGGYTPTQSISHPDQHDLYISPTNPNLIYLANDGGLWKSTNGAATLQNLNATLGLTMFTSIEMHPTNRRLTYGGTQDNGTQKRVAGQGWIEFSTGDGGQTILDPLDPSIVYTTYVYNTIYRHPNGGGSGSAQIGNNTVFSSDRVAFYPPFVGNGADSTLYFGTFRLWKSANRGASWTAPAGIQDLTHGGGDVLSAIGVGRSNTNIIYTGSAQGRVMVSANGGANWTNANTGLPTRFIKSIIVSPTDSNTAYLTVSGFDSGHVFKTTNAGASWTDISGNLPNIPTNTILIDPREANTLYVGTDIGVFRSTNGGGNWETFNMGMPPIIVTELAANSRGLIQAATYGRGMYEINLGAPDKTFIDFDGDGRTDYSIFRPTAGEWWYLQSSNSVSRAFQFGSSSDKIVPADYTGDGKTDVAFFRPSTNEWFVLRSENFTFYSAPFGAAGDIPVPGDYDGDGKDDFAVFRPSDTNWYVNRSSGGFSIQQFGASSDKPVPADYDGDGKTDLAIFRPSVGEWWILRSSDGVNRAFQFGNNSDKPIPADYTGDGKTDVAFFRPSTREWFVLRSENSSFYSAPFGASGDIPVPGDYDGDGKADVAVWRESDRNWYVVKSSGGFFISPFGSSGDKPVPSAFIL